jgi:hypothetical protein
LEFLPLLDSGSAGLGVVDLKSRWGNLFASTNGTATRGIQASPFLEREAALFTRGRFRNKALRVYGLLNVFEMIEDLSFLNPEPLRDLSEVKQFFFQDFCDPLPHG